VLDLTPSGPPISPPSRFAPEATLVAGALASTYRARDLVAGRAVTLTLIHPNQEADGFFLARFEREARLLAEIDHPNVARLVACGVENGSLFVAIEHVPGRTLADAIRERGPCGAAEATSMARQILTGLGAIHDAGLLHLRLTPRTIFLGDDGVVRITDVGIASLGADDDSSDRGGAIEGARYLAPELIEGGDVCEATDLYAVGAILFEALTAQPPFPGTNPVLVRFAQLQAPPPIPSQFVATGVPPVLDAVVARALAKNPAHRFSDAQTMANALSMEGANTDIDHVFGQPTVSAPLLATPQLAERPVPAIRPTEAAGIGRPERSRRRRQDSTGWLWPLAIACAVIALLIGALAASLSGDSPPTQAVAGVSTYEESNPPPPTTPTPAAFTPTPRVLRASNQSAEPAPTRASRKARTSSAAKTPRPTRTPASSN
jgi:serine/threonine-protein kinase